MSFYYTIIPQAKLPRNMISGFTYASRERHVRGEVVLVEFRKKKVLGLVLQETPRVLEESVEIKPILDSVTHLPPCYVTLIEWMSQYYCTSRANIWSLFSPPLLLVHGYTKYTHNAKNLPHAPLKPRSIFTGKLTAAEKIDLTARLIEDTQNQKQSVLVLTPKNAILSAFTHMLQNTLHDTMHVVTGSLHKNKTRYTKLWHECLTHRTQIVIGTRSAIFLPLGNIGRIVIVHGESDDFKQYDQNPRYDARTIARKLSQFAGIPLTFFCDGAML